MRKDPIMFGAQLILEAIRSVVLGIRASPDAIASKLQTWKYRGGLDAPIEETIFESPIYSTKKETPTESEECPEFQEIYEAGNDLVIGVEYLELSPDEKAVFRIVGETTFSKQYRKRVYTLRDGTKYFAVDNKRYFIRKARVWSE